MPPLPSAPPIALEQTPLRPPVPPMAAMVDTERCARTWLAYCAHITRSDVALEPATFFGPKGDIQEGAEKVLSIYKRDAKHFGKDSQNQIEVMQHGAGGDVAYWVGIQRALARVEGDKDLVPMNLRVTEIFRREEGHWKLVHRHADMLKAESEKT